MTSRSRQQARGKKIHSAGDMVCSDRKFSFPHSTKAPTMTKDPLNDAFIGDLMIDTKHQLKNIKKPSKCVTIEPAAPKKTEAKEDSKLQTAEKMVVTVSPSESDSHCVTGELLMHTAAAAAAAAGSVELSTCICESCDSDYCMDTEDDWESDYLADDEAVEEAEPEPLVVRRSASQYLLATNDLAAQVHARRKQFNGEQAWVAAASGVRYKQYAPLTGVGEEHTQQALGGVHRAPSAYLAPVMKGVRIRASAAEEDGCACV